MRYRLYCSAILASLQAIPEGLTENTLGTCAFEILGASGRRPVAEQHQSSNEAQTVCLCGVPGLLGSKQHRLIRGHTARSAAPAYVLCVSLARETACGLARADENPLPSSLLAVALVRSSFAASASSCFGHKLSPARWRAATVQSPTQDEIWSLPHVLTECAVLTT